MNYLPEFSPELMMLTPHKNSISGSLSVTGGERVGKCSNVFPVSCCSGRVANKKFNDIFWSKKESPCRIEKTHAGGYQGKLGDGDMVITKASKAKKSLGGLVQRLENRIAMPWQPLDCMVSWVSPATKLRMQAIRKYDTDAMYRSSSPWCKHLVAGKLARAIGGRWDANFCDSSLEKNSARP